MAVVVAAAVTGAALRRNAAANSAKQPQTQQHGTGSENKSETEYGLNLISLLALVIGVGAMLVFTLGPVHDAHSKVGDDGVTDDRTAPPVVAANADSPETTASGRVPNGGGGYRYSPTRWVESYSYDTFLWNSNRRPGQDGTPSIERCNIPKVDARTLSREAFEDEYLERAPVVLLHATDTAAFRKAVQKEALLAKFENFSVTLSSANRHSYAKREVPLGVYVREMMGKGGPQRLDAKGSDTWYHFGDNKHDEWRDVFDHYEKPSKYIFGPFASLSFGIGASGSGVPFHTHGHVFAEVFYGRKRWYLAPWEHEPPSDPDESTLQWLSHTYPTMDIDGLMETVAATGEGEAGDKDDVFDVRSDVSSPKPRRSGTPVYQFYECTLRAGEMLYIPTRWHHSTLNLGETVFMSVFV